MTRERTESFQVQQSNARFRGPFSHEFECFPGNGVRNPICSDDSNGNRMPRNSARLVDCVDCGLRKKGHHPMLAASRGGLEFYNQFLSVRRGYKVGPSIFTAAGLCRPPPALFAKCIGDEVLELGLVVFG